MAKEKNTPNHDVSRGREPGAIFELEQPVNDVTEVLVYKPDAKDFVAYMDHDDSYSRSKAIVPMVAYPAKGDQPTGESFTDQDVDLWDKADVLHVDELMGDLLNLEDAMDYADVATDEITLTRPIVMGDVTVKRLKFEPKTFGDAKAFIRAKGESAKLKKFVETMAIDPDNPDMPLGSMFFNMLSGHDVARIMFGHLGNGLKKSKKSHLL